MLHTCGERLYSAWVIVCVWFVFLCLHIMISRVISIVPNSRISSFFYVEIISHCVYEPPSLHSLIWWWSRKQVLQLVHCKQGHRNLPLCRPLLPSDFVSASAQWWDRQTFNSSFNSCGVFTLFSKMGMACTSAQCVRLLWLSSSLDPIFVTVVGVIGEHVRQCFLVVLLAFPWWLAVLHIMANTYEHWAISLWGITSQVLRSSKSQFIIVLLWRCLISYKCGIIFTRGYTLRIFSPIL